MFAQPFVQPTRSRYARAVKTVSRARSTALELSLDAVGAVAQAVVAVAAGSLVRALAPLAPSPPGMTPLSRWWADRALRAEPRTWAWVAVAALGLRVLAHTHARVLQVRAAAELGGVARRRWLEASLADPGRAALGVALTLPEQLEAASLALRARRRAFLHLIVLGATALALDPWISLGLLGAVGLFGLALRPIRRALRRAHTKALAVATARVEAVDDTLRHAAIWAAWRGGPTVLRRLDDLSTDAATLAATAERRQALASGLNEVLAGVAIALLVGVLAPSGQAARPTLLPLLVVLLSLYRPLRDLGDAAGAWTRGRLAAEALGALPMAGVADSTVYPPATLALEALAVDVGGSTVRAGVTLEAHVGAPIAFVGPPGSGKSALLEALVGARPHRGTVRYDGRPLEGPPGFGRPFAWVPASPPTLPGTLAENLCPQAPGDTATLRRARDLLRALGDRELSALSDETWLGPRGRRLSSGEAQRVALARALASDRPVLLLDEPTANLDADGEARAIELLRAAAADRVLVLVSHRPGPLALAARTLAL